MNDRLDIRVIARIHNDYIEKFGIPRQSGLVPDMQSVIVFEKDFRNREALRGIEEYSHLWLIWGFSENEREGFSPTVRPPRLGGNTRTGVFATRSPFRPNPLGLSSVRLIGVEQTPEDGVVLRVSGADMMNGTPIFDIKPYVAYSDAHPEAVCGFADRYAEYTLEVVCPDKLLDGLNDTQRDALLRTLSNDPRPAYQHDAERVYAMRFADRTVRFAVSGTVLTVLAVERA